MSSKSFDITIIYNKFIKSQSEINRSEMLEKYPKQGISYRASSSGMCSRKLYYESVMRLEPTEQINDKTMRIFRLGDLVHTDIQQALVDVIQRKEPKETI
tara:strand:- start:52 stop:351 length:300 start_codon:yes stop_codon:yes gene_type:complete